MNKFASIILLFSAFSFSLKSNNAYGQNSEQNFQDIFITAGYATAFGAALGAAALGLQNNPEENLNYIAVGASLGFIGGSIMGAYMVFTPVMAENPSQTSSMLANNMNEKTLYVRPYISNTKNKITAVEGAMTILSF